MLSLHTSISSNFGRRAPVIADIPWRAPNRVTIRAGEVWGLLAKGDDRQHGGNLGYDDLLPQYYTFDSTVGNGRHVRIGDVVVLHNGTSVLGLAQIQAIEQQPAIKVRRRCPMCHRTSIKDRKTMLPIYKCFVCKHVFDRPLEETLDVTSYRLDYPSNWWYSPQEIPLRPLRKFFTANAEQHSIRPMEPAVLEALAQFGLALPPSQVGALST